MRDFRKYKVWNDSISLVTDIYNLLKSFPVYERYALSDQMRRSAVSVASNIAEGASRTSSKEFDHFLQISIGSAFELETQLTIANSLSYIDEDQLDNMLVKIDSLEKRLNKLISTLRDNKSSSQKLMANGQISV